MTVDWAAVERDYRDRTVPVATILERHGLTERRFYTQARQHGWPVRQPNRRPTCRALNDMKRVANAIRRRLVAVLEREGDEKAEWAGNLLLKLVRVQERIAAMERAAQPKAPTSPGRTDDEDRADHETDQAILDRYVEQRLRERTAV